MSAAGNPMVVLALMIVDALGRGASRAAVGSTIDDRIVFTPRAQWRVQMFAGALDVEAPRSGTQRALARWACSLVGLLCTIDVALDDNGEVRVHYRHAAGSP